MTGKVTLKKRSDGVFATPDGVWQVFRTGADVVGWTVVGPGVRRSVATLLDAGEVIVGGPAKVRKRTRKGAVHREATAANGQKVLLIDADHPDAGVDRDGGRWVTLCEEHGGVCNHTTKKVARDFLRHPEEWCPTCQGNP